MLWNTFNTKIPMVILMVYLLGYDWDEKMENLLGFSVVFLLGPIKNPMMANLVVVLIMN